MRKLVTAFCATALLSGCTELQLATHFTKEAVDKPAPYQAPAVEGPRKIGKPYQIEGTWYYPISDSSGYTAKGIASWYGKEFHAKKTANGETYNMYDVTAAHPTLPLPTYVRVTNLSNGRSIVVRVNDRGPFLRGRIIDLSYRAAQLLGYVEQGTTPVLLEALPHDGSPLLTAANPDHVPFKKYGQGATPPPQRTSASVAKAQALQQQQQKGGSFTNRIANGIPVEPSHPKIEATEKLPSTNIATLSPVKIFVQTGSFGDKANAQKQVAKLSNYFTNAYVAETVINGKTFYRVRIGPVENVDMADQVLARAIHEGHKQAIIVVD